MAYRELVAAAPPRGAPRHAAWTVPAQPIGPATAGRRIGWAAMAAGLGAVVGVVGFRLIEGRSAAGREPSDNAEVAAARDLSAGAAVLAFSVFADSAIEHYRGAYHNPAMYVAPTVAAVSLANSIHMAITPERTGAGRLALSALTFSTGLVGLAFHVYNVAKREGGMRLVNLFYGAPLLAPAAIATSGLVGLAAAQLVAEAEEGEKPTLLGLPAGTVIGVATAGAMIGTTAEAALLHFRGAFHDPFMFVPVTLPPTAAAGLIGAVLLPRLRGPVRRLLQLTAAAGVAGAGFHVYGVSRNMGGLYNWSQNVLNGPPIPAPPSFTGVALAGLAAVGLMDAR